MLHRFVEPAQLLQNDAGVVAGLRVIATDIDCLLKISQGTAAVARGVTAQPALVAGDGVSGGFCEGMSEQQGCVCLMVVEGKAGRRYCRPAQVQNVSLFTVSNKSRS